MARVKYIESIQLACPFNSPVNFDFPYPYNNLGASSLVNAFIRVLVQFDNGDDSNYPVDARYLYVLARLENLGSVTRTDIVRVETEFEDPGSEFSVQIIDQTASRFRVTVTSSRNAPYTPQARVTIDVEATELTP